MTAFESIKQGLTEAIAYAEGKDTRALVHRVDVPEVDVAAIRASTAFFRNVSTGPCAKCSVCGSNCRA